MTWIFFFNSFPSKEFENGQPKKDLINGLTLTFHCSKLEQKRTPL